MSKSPRGVHDSAFKTRVVLEALKGARTLAQLSTEFGIHAQQITDWKKQALEVYPRCSNQQRPKQRSPNSNENKQKLLFFSRLVN